MSITTQAFRLALTAAALCGVATTADARPRRVVILDFDGPRQLADTGRSSVLSVLGQQYDVIATKRWEQARASAAHQSHGPAQWSRAAKQAGVDAVIEGWVQDEGRRKILNVVVREARNGREFDTISVRLDGKHGVSTESSRQLQTSLDEVLDWIDAGQNEPAAAAIPIIDVKKIGPTTRVGPSRQIDDDGGDSGRSQVGRATSDDDDATAPPKRRPKRRSGEAPAPVEVEASDTPPARPAPGTGEVEAAPAPEPAHEPRPVEVSTAAREAHEIEILFPQNSDVRKQLLGDKADHVPQRTTRFMIDAGPYFGSRSLIWDAEPDSELTQFAGVTSKGFDVHAAVYPFPTKATDGVLSGVGFTGSLHHSAGSSVIFPDEETVEEYVINQNGWEFGIHYRTPISGMVAIDGGAFYGNQTYEIVDASPNFEVPDTRYSYLGASAHLDLAITDRALIGFGARYFTVLDAGDLASVDWFGPADASGLGLEGSFVIPLPASLYVRGQLSYQRISLDLSGGGVITDEEGVLSGKDSLIIGNVNVGISF